ncbi:hypothetical protein ACHAWF_000834, partial [Thalassiosira exigua]
MRCWHTRRKVRAFAPFCRAPSHHSDEEFFQRINNRIKPNDAGAYVMLGWAHHDGDYGLVPNKKKAFELWLKGSELGAVDGHTNVGFSYLEGKKGVPKNEERAYHYLELAAIAGDAVARYNLAVNELNKRNFDLALKHLMIAARSGFNESLIEIKNLFVAGRASKNDYETALRAHKDAIDAITSDQRNLAVAELSDTLEPVRYISVGSALWALSVLLSSTLGSLQ